MPSDLTDGLLIDDSTLDLSGEGGRRIELRSACVTAWRLLSGRNVTEVLLPTDLSQRRVLARAGVLTAADRSGAALMIEGRRVSVVEALRAESAFPGIDWVSYSGSEDLGRLRIIDDLELPQRRPPAPLPNGRRYRWIDGLKAATALGRDAARFNGDADQVLYEAISNVSRWSGASAAYACFSMTAGGGLESFNRFHVVVADDGMGVVDSVERRRIARQLPDWRRTDRIRALAVEHGCSPEAALVLHLVEDSYGDRTVASTQDGHGLHTSGVLARQWSGSFDLHTTGPESEVVITRTRRGPLQVSERDKSSAGTLFHVTLEASQSGDDVERAQDALVSAID